MQYCFDYDYEAVDLLEWPQLFAPADGSIDIVYFGLKNSLLRNGFPFYTNSALC